MEPTKVYLVEDHPQLRSVMSFYLGSRDDLQVCGSSSDAETALAELADADPDLFVIDLNLPGMNGIELVGKIRQARPDTPCLLLSGHSDARYAEQGLEAGAAGFIVKGDSAEICQAIRKVLAGETYVSATLVKSRAEPSVSFRRSLG